MKKIVLGFVLGVCAITGFAKPEKWILDEAHTKIGFEIPHLIISSVEGKYNTFAGSLIFDIAEKEPKNLIKTVSFAVDINADSINTGNEKRDNHLKGADFFNVKKKGHEKISFKSSAIKTVDGKKFKVSGNLTMNNVTKPVTIVFSYAGSAKVYDVMRIAFTGKLTVKREDYGLTWNDGEVKASNFAGKLAEAAGAVGSEVQIDLKIQAKRAADL